MTGIPHQGCAINIHKIQLHYIKLIDVSQVYCLYFHFTKENMVLLQVGLFNRDITQADSKYVYYYSMCVGLQCK